jgi:hypothetical protein
MSTTLPKGSVICVNWFELLYAYWVVSAAEVPYPHVALTRSPPLLYTHAVSTPAGSVMDEMSPLFPHWVFVVRPLASVMLESSVLALG